MQIICTFTQSRIHSSLLWTQHRRSTSTCKRHAILHTVYYPNTKLAATHPQIQSDAQVKYENVERSLKLSQDYAGLQKGISQNLRQ